MSEIKVGDKVKIVCKNGDSSSTKIYHKGKRLDFVTSIQINISSDNNSAEAKIGVMTPVIELDNVKISEIMDHHPKVKSIEKIIGKMHMQKVSNKGLGISTDLSYFLDEIEKVIHG